ncbi:MAG: ABC transporter ATP-binding protein [Candidatus Korarchaeum sp.]
MAVEIRDLTFTYANKEKPALERISLRIEEGETVLLLGRSGCGKSTLIKAMNGLIPNRYEGTYEGEVRVFGITVKGASLSKLSRMVGTVMQEVGKQLVLPKVEDDVAFGPCNLCFTREDIERRVESSLASVNALHLRERDVNELSGGEKQRVAIAGILAMDPKLVLMDEPLANLDGEGVRLVQEQIRMLKGRGKTLVIAEHRTEEVLEVGVDRILFMDEGRLVREIRREEELRDLLGIVKIPPRILISEYRKIDVEEVRKSHESDVIAIKIEDLSFEYDGRQVIRDLNLEVREGERIALLGNNGAGKSTLAKLILGILKPNRGRVLVYGMDTREKEVYELANYVGLVFQDPLSMLFARTVEEELSYGPRNLGVSLKDLRERVLEAALNCGIDHLLPYSPFASSYGEKKRISVASILTMRPRVLILDEPTAGQDYASYTAFMEFIRGLMGTVKTIILITHDTDLAVEYTDRTVILSDGRIVADGPTREVLAREEYLRAGRIRETDLLRIGRELTGGRAVLSLKEVLKLCS